MRLRSAAVGGWECPVAFQLYQSAAVSLHTPPPNSAPAARRGGSEERVESSHRGGEKQAGFLKVVGPDRRHVAGGIYWLPTVLRLVRNHLGGDK